jgi:hypothetical protein
VKSATRSHLIALLCTVLLFAVVGVYLFFDEQAVDERNRQVKAEIAAVDATASAGSSAAAPPPAPPAPIVNPAPSVPPAAEAPSPSAGRSGGTPLNDTLKLASTGDWPAVDAMLATIASTSPPGDTRPGKPVIAARKLVEARDYPAAIDALTTAVAGRPEDAEALNLLAYSLVRQGRAADAQPYVTRSLYLAPRRGATWANAAEIFAEQENALAASAALKVALYLSQDRARSLAFLSHDDPALQGRKFRAVIGQVLQEAAEVPSAGERAVQTRREAHA